MDSYNYEDFLRNRITILCKINNITEHKLSKALGHSKNYIQGITAKKSLPAMSEFLYLCEYFKITPKEFFDDSIEHPILMQKAIEGMKTLTENDLMHLIYFINRLNGKD